MRVDAQREARVRVAEVLRKRVDRFAYVEQYRSRAPRRPGCATPRPRPLQGVDGVEMRFHKTTLYNSIFRFDEIIINTHVYGFQGAHEPSRYLCRRLAGDLFEAYSERFE